MKRIQTIIATSTGVLALTLASALSAAPYGAGAGCDGSGPGPGAGRMGMHQGGMGPGMGPGMGGGFGVDAAAGLATMKTKLAITAEQETAWQAFAMQSAEQSKQMQAMHAQHRAAVASDTSAPAMMSLRIGAMTQRLAAMQAMNKALTDLYAVLTPQQRTIADLLFDQRGMGGQRHGMRG